MNLAGAFRFSSSLVFIMDAGDGSIVDVNPAFERRIGYMRDEIVGKPPGRFEIWPDIETRARLWTRVRTEGCVRSDHVTFRSRQGVALSGTVQCEMFVLDGTSSMLVVIQDVREAGVESDVDNDPGNYRALFLAAAEGLYRSLPNGGWIDVNPALARTLGYESPAQLLLETNRRRVSELYVDPNHAARLYKLLDDEGQFEDEHAEVRCRNGQSVWISENGRAVRNAEGRIMYYEGSIVDITQRVRAQTQLRQSEALYKTLIENCRDGVFLVHHDHVIFANQTLADMLGYNADELAGRRYMDFVAPESVAEQNERRASHTDGSRSMQDYEVQVLRKDGAHRLMRVRAGAVEYNGEIASTGTLQDITDDRAAQLALAAAERKYRSLFKNSVTGMFQSHPDGGLIQANDALARILGYDSADALMSGVTHMNQIYSRADDRTRLIERLLKEGGVDDVIFSARRRNGGEVIVELSARTILDGNGNPHYIEGSAQDVTARLDAERALQQSEMRYRTLVEHSQAGVYMMLDDRYTYVNHAFAAMFGYSESELIGADFRVLVPPESSKQQETRYRRQTQTDKNRGDYCVTLLRKDGVRIDTMVSAGTASIDGRAYTTGTIRDVTDERRAQRQLEHNASHDLLTGLPNRVFFEEELSRVIGESRAMDSNDYAVLFLDLDGFKLVNDSLGHASGDVLLVHIAETLHAQLGSHCLIARYGGDEFTLLPHGACPRARAEQLAQRVLTLLAGSFDVNGHRVFSGASVGVVLGRPEYHSPDQVLRDADTAMYRAKASGKSAYIIFDDAMHAAARARLKIETELRFALERGEFHVFYQPIVDLPTGRVRSCEALVRWQHPERGLLLPASFLDVAEETGTLVAIDWWVLEHTCRNLIRWQRRHPAHAALRVNVNIDERQFAEPNVVANVRDILNRTGVDPACLALEITETVFRRGRKEAEVTLSGLKALGVALVVDDFGTGYSSLDSFATSPFDALKVDQSFVRDMVTNFRHRAIVRTIASLAVDLGLSLIAEGVERADQAEVLVELGYGGAQGFLYSPALPLDDLERVLEHGFSHNDGSAADAVA
ncbi:MAG TPA: PAS domain S-box protein [Rudaea sp.]|jgi:diguanylate cyclase (GGDEF)-like protein/PAS domain S-box-containing protein|nr:PAS domain S-box protein [Rudaea sp.]